MRWGRGRTRLWVAAGRERDRIRKQSSHSRGRLWHNERSGRVRSRGRLRYGENERLSEECGR